MGIYNFQSRFVPMIMAGRKTHTIRDHRVHPDKPGNTLHLYTGLRKSGATLLMRVPCIAVEEIEITITPGNGRVVRINGMTLDRTESEALAKRDGFKDFSAMMAFWDGRVPFKGQIIHWKYAGKP
jgi:uncharacterized protein YqfB (UPF0267 family)